MMKKRLPVYCVLHLSNLLQITELKALSLPESQVPIKVIKWSIKYYISFVGNYWGKKQNMATN